MSSARHGSDIGKRYASALLSLAGDTGSLDRIAGDVAMLEKLLDTHAGFARMTQAAIVARAQQRAAVLAIADNLRLTPLTRKFLGILADNRRLGDLGVILASVRSGIAEHKGEISAEISSAQPLSPAQVEQTKSALEKALNKKITLELHQDPALLGGMIVRVGSKMIDQSVRTRLSRLHRALKDSTRDSNASLMREVA